MNEADRLALQGGVSELTRVAPWVEALALTYAIPGETVLAMELCLEEALANVVLHGYSGGPGPVTVEFEHAGGEWVFTVEDEAPHFDPQPRPAAIPKSLDEMKPGGMGILLMRRFADQVDWEPTAKGNRLKIRFSARS